MFKRTALALGVVAALSVAAPVFSQSTSASLSGRVTDPSGAPIAGASVEIVHQPSGSRRTVATDAEGRFSAAGLRVGGPYTISSQASGKESAEQTNVFLNLDEVSSLSLVMGGEPTSLDAVEVSATAIALTFSPDNMGARTNITKDEIESFPSISRSLQDYVRFDPRIVQTDKERGQISAAGQNNRYNNIKIDGVPTNDQFGLNDSGLPSLNQPISIDWIQEFNVGISNYDVTQSDFTGANINAVTKSGGNEFHGAFYGVYRNSDMVSDEPSEFLGFDDEYTYGAYVSGPIVQDTLFFFVGYEEFQRSSPGPNVTIQSNPATDVTGLTQAHIDQIRQIAQSQYGFAIGDDRVPGVDNTDEKWVVKLDWNINDAHRLAYRYNETDGTVPRLSNLTRTRYSLSSNWFEDNLSFKSHALMLYSNWSDVLSTEANISYSNYDSVPQIPLRSPQVQVNVAGTPSSVYFGTDRSRHANRLGNDTLTAYFAADMFLGDHTVRAGFDYEANDVFNLFLQDVFGSYVFNSIDNFAAGNWQSFSVQAPISGDINSAAANFKFANLGLFIQDTWAVTPQFNIVYGLRMDRNDVNDSPAFNSAALTAFGYDNTETTDGQVTVQPRFGFNYSFDTERATQLRGGVGLFQGSAPGVWLSNMFSNPGVLTRVFPGQNGSGFSADPDNQPRPAGTAPAQNVDFLAPDFQQPTVWRANLAFEHELPWYGLVASAEYLRTVVDKGVTFEHLNLGNAVGTLPDGRNYYWTNVLPTSFNSNGNTSAVQNRSGRNRSFNNVILLDNTEGGASTNFTLGLEKPFADNWGAKFSYTFARSDEVSPATSSVAASNWQFRNVYNPNEEVISPSNYEIRDRFTAAVTYRAHWFENYPTTFALFYDGREGRNYSFGFTGDANGDGITGNDLLFIPSAGQVAYTAASSANDIAAFRRYIEEVDYLRENQGQVASRNALQSPNVNQFDLRVSQELPGFFAENKAQVYLDIQNIGNLINKNWGQIDEIGFPYNLGVARFAGVNAAGQYVYDVSNYVNESTSAITYPTPIRRDTVGESRWSVQVGFRYEF
jgi:outer membrane receptor for ferrienterochelin and colicin